VCGSVQDSDSMRASTARGGNSETRAFDAISITSFRKRGLFAQALFSWIVLRRRYLDKAVTSLFHNSTMQH